MDAKNALERYNRLLERRPTGLWHDIERLCVPYKGKFSIDSVDPYTLYNDTVFRDINILSSGLYSYLTNPATRWFVLDADTDVMAEKVKAAKATDELHRYFRMSNFYQKLNSFYRELAIYGVSALYEEENPNLEGFRFMGMHPKTFVFDRDVWGEVTFVAMEIKMAAGEARRLFDKIPDSIAKAQDNETVNVLFVVYKDGDRNKPYKSMWIEKESAYVMREGAYATMPVFVGQWSDSNESVYASSPAIDAYASVVLANRITKTYWLNNEKLANPPLDVPYDGYAGDIDISPGAINYRTTGNPNERILPIITSGNVNITIESIQDVQNDIHERFFIDLFLMDVNKEMTATEVIQRTQEKMLLLGAVIGKLVDNVFKPIIARSLQILIEQGIVEPMDSHVKVEFLSPLAQTQKSSEYSSLVVLLNTVLQIAQVDPSVVDNINFDEFIRKVGDIYSIDARMFNDEDTVAATRQQRQQVQMMQLQLQMKEQEAKANKQQAQAQVNMAKSQKVLYE